ncbi:peptidoglycan-binding protein [Labrenzia sp. CE80]|uniref:peptidoglycan-binding protein n=1 Tax=Labrenzia sp. CE80 TaxID=1788986 RepID=UPI00129A8A11|nr:peptidoglycan-binding protein [Labrenzia sp. CE80]
MPAWKNREAGRRGRIRNEPHDEGYFDAGLDERDARRPRPSRHEQPGDRIERLTRTATSLGDQGRRRRARPMGGEGELEAVANELDRLLSDREADAAPRRPSRGQALARRSKRDRSPPRDGGRLDQVIGALEKLDRKVEGLADKSQYGDEYREDFGARHDFDADDRRSAYDAPYPDEDYEPDAYGADLGHDDDYCADEYDDYEEAAYAYAEPRGRRRMPSGSHGARNDPGIGAYKDLGRRIDSLRKPQMEAFNMVRQELGSLRDAIGGYSSVTQERTGKQNAELRRLANMVERLRVERQDDRFAKEVRKEVSELKSLVGRTNVDGTLKTLEHGYAHILQRLDELSRATIDPRVLRGVTARLNEIEDSFAALPRGEHMLVLEDRVSSIAERVEELLHRNSHEEIEPLRLELREVRNFVEQIDIGGLVESIDDRMRFVAGRLDELEILAREQRGLDTRLSAMEDRLPDADTLNRLQGRLEDIVGMMSDERAMGEAPKAFAALEERLATISGKIDTIEKTASRPTAAMDAAALAAADPAGIEALGELQMRISDLAEQLDKPRDNVTTSDLDALRQEIGDMRKAVASPASTDALEQRISDLADAVARGSEGLDEQRLEQLGSKVAALAEQLETSGDRDEDMKRVTTALARIEDGLKTTREEVVAIARDAAKEAVSANPSARAPEYDKAIEGLQGDLRRLLDAADGSEERTRNTFNGVQSVLGSLTDRLERLERMDHPAPTSPASATAGGDAGFLGRGLNKLRQPEPQEERSSERVRDRKADFIAAARRAAQAASQEAAMIEAAAGSSDPKDDKAEDRNAARTGWLRNVLKRNSKKSEDAVAEELVLDTPAFELDPAEENRVLPGDRPAPEDTPAAGGGRRRALLFAAAAVVLMIGTLQVFKMVTTSGDGSSEADKVAVTTQEPAVPQVAKTEEPAEAIPNTEEAAPVRAAGAVKSPPDSGSGKAESAAAPKVAPPAEPVQLAPQLASAPATQPVKPASQQAPTPAAPGPETPDTLAFAPPSGVGGSFGAEVPPLENEISPAGQDVVPASLVAKLPPEAVGPMALRSAAASGNAAAAFLVGVKYTEGKSVPADLAEAAKWYQKAADLGLAPAEYRLASLYEKGRGVEKDLEKARQLYTKAAEAGNAKAMHNLAVLYAEGADSAPDFAKAGKWFESAANYGVKDSLFNLGILYARGLGVEKDLVASYKWFAIAADQGDRDAAKKRDDVANMMDQETLAAARLAVETFKLKTPDPVANKVITNPEWAAAGDLSTNASISLGNVVDYEGMVREAQTRLNQLGFETGTPDGQMGPRTRSAIRAFQRSLGKVETGEVDADLIKELESQSI